MGNLLTALQASKRTLSDRVHFIHVELNNIPDSTKYTAADLQKAKDELDEVEAAIAAVKLHRKVRPLSDQTFTKIIKVKDLREALSHPVDQEKPLWTYDEQSATFDNIVGIVLNEYEGKPNVNLVINVLPDGKR